MWLREHVAELKRSGIWLLERTSGLRQKGTGTVAQALRLWRGVVRGAGTGDVSGMPWGRAERPERPSPDPVTERPLMLLLVLALVLGAAAGTEYAAWRFRFDPTLGVPLLVLSASSAWLCRVAGVLAGGAALAAVSVRRLRPMAAPLVLVALVSGVASVGRVYAPYRIFLWYGAFATRSSAAPVFQAGWVLGATVALAGACAVTSLWRRARQPSPSTSHGSARWGTGDLLDSTEGLLLGRQGTRCLRFAGEGHVLTVAPTRSGKGVSAVIPNLLDHPGSVLVTDPKGENYAVTASWREKLGQQVHAFDPFGVVKGTATYNPLDLIDVKTDAAVDNARLLADMLVLPGTRERDEAFWNEEARGLLTGLILHAAASADLAHRTLGEVRSLLTHTPDAFAGLLQAMLASPAARGLLARAAARLLQKDERERSGVVSTAQSHTHFLDSPRMTEILAHAPKSEVDLAVLKREPTSVYLILPTDRFEGYARWLRLMIACALLAMARTAGQPQQRVLFLLDEFAHLGRMQPVQRDIGLAGGFGVTFWLVVQDFAQLRSTYDDAWPTFLANMDVLQAFGINDWDTAEYLSKLTGEATVSVTSKNRSHGVSRGRYGHSQRGAAQSVADWGRRLLTADEVRRLPRELQLLFVKGGAPLLARRLDYLRDREFADRAAPNPLYRSVAAAQAQSGATVDRSVVRAGA
jgi:type IV secretion system protein VirD4